MPRFIQFSDPSDDGIELINASFVESVECKPITSTVSERILGWKVTVRTASHDIQVRRFMERPPQPGDEGVTYTLDECRAAAVSLTRDLTGGYPVDPNSDEF